MQIKKCKISDCPLAKKKEVPYSGNKKAKLLLCGESPGVQEVKSGKPFVGDSGDLLKEICAAIGLDWASLFIVNSARCMIYKKEMSGKAITQTLAYCRPYLVRAINVIKPKGIIVAGDFALRQLTRRSGITKHRGKWIWSEEFNCWLLPVFHPAYILRNPGLRQKLVDDLRQAKAFLDNDCEPVVNNETLRYQEVQSIKPVLAQKDLSIAIDTEGQGLDWTDPDYIMVSYSITWAHGQGVSIRLWDECPVGKADFVFQWPRTIAGKKKKEMVDVGVKRSSNFKQKLQELWALLESTNLRKYMMNGSFDLHVLNTTFRREFGGVPTVRRYVMDIQAAAHVVDENLYLMASLDELQRSFTDYGQAYNQEFEQKYDKSDMLAVPAEELVPYACLAKNSKIQMADGTLQNIDYLVKTKSTSLVKSRNLVTNKIEYKPITGWHKIYSREKIEWLSVLSKVHRDGRWGKYGMTRYTPDHKLLTTHGWKEIKDISAGDKIITPYQKLSSSQKQIVLGGLLGDSSVSQRNSSGYACLSMSHCEKQRKYLQWKASFFVNIGVSFDDFKSTITEIAGQKVTNVTQTYRAQTKQHPEFRDLREMVYPNDLKEVGPWVTELNALGLAVWYMDDGCLVGDKTIRLHTNSFSTAEVEELENMIYSNFGITAGHYHIKRNNECVLTIATLWSSKFFDLIASFVHPCMQYKLPLKWQNQFKPLKNLNTLPYIINVKRIFSNPAPAKHKGLKKVSYCIDVADTHNFFTQGEIAHNCADSDVTLRVAKKLRTILLEKKYYKQVRYFVKFVMPALSKILFSLEENGAYIDQDELPKAMIKVEKLMNAASAIALKNIKKSVRSAHKEKGLRLTRDDLIRDALFDEDGFALDVIKRTAGGAPSVDKGVRALLLEKKLTKKCRTFLEQFNLFSEYHTLWSRYLKGFKKHIKKDGRIHSSLSLTTAVTGRVACVPEDAEMLTLQGWKRKAQLKIGEDVIGFDVNKGKLVITDLRGVHAGIGKVGKLLYKHGKTRQIGIECTKEHSWVVSDGRVRGFMPAKHARKAGDGGKACFELLLSAKTPADFGEDNDIVGAELIGWALTDGHIDQTSADRYYLWVKLVKEQSKKRFKKTVLGKVSFSEQVSGFHNRTVFGIGVGIFNSLWKKFLSFKSPISYLCSLSESARKGMWEVMMEADGSIRHYGGGRGYYRFGNAVTPGPYKPNVGDIFSALSVLIGKSLIYRERNIVGRKPFMDWEISENLRKIPSYLPEVRECAIWCPETGTGTWIIRQNGVVGITGNSSKPNMMNIPKRSKSSKIIRKLIKAAPGYLLMAADEAQSELRWMAALSGDQEMARVFRCGEDIHTNTAKALTQKPWASLSKDDIDMARRNAKSVNFGLLYLMSVNGFIKYAKREYGIELTFEQGEAWVKTFFRMYKRIPTYHRKTIEFCQQHGYVESVLGRRRHLPEIWSKDDFIRGGAERMAVNHPIQNPSSDIVLMAGNEIADQGHNPEEFRSILFIHDELIYEVKDNSKVIDYGKILKEAMENPPLERDFGYKMPIPLVSDIKIGHNLAELKELDLNL